VPRVRDAETIIVNGLLKPPSQSLCIVGESHVTIRFSGSGARPVKVKINSSARSVEVDGVARVCLFEPPAGVHAIVWDGRRGYYESVASSYRDTIEWFEDETEIAPYVEAWRMAGAPARPLEHRN
jgi:hypothetical protein